MQIWKTRGFLAQMEDYCLLSKWYEGTSAYAWS